MRKFFHCFLCLFLFIQYSIARDRITGEPFATRSEVPGQNGMVATSHPLATRIGPDVLKRGANAKYAGKIIDSLY